jgi:tetratricopeptide (TPR) repeat protein
VNFLMRLSRASVLAGLTLGIAAAAPADPRSPLKEETPVKDGAPAKAAAPAKPDAPAKSAATAKPEVEAKARVSDYLAGRAAQLERDWRTAGPLIRRAWETDPEDVGLRHDALLLSVAGGDFAGALQVARVVPSDSSDAPLANFVLLLDDFIAGRYVQAETRLAAAPAHGPDRYLAPLLTAWCEVGRGRKVEALAALAQLSNAAGAGELLALQTAMVTDALGDHAQASELYDKIVAATPPLHALLIAAQHYQRQGATDKARKTIEQIDPDGSSSSVRAEMLTRIADKARTVPAPDPKVGAADALFSISATLTSQKQADIAPLLYVQFALHVRPDFPSGQLLLAEIDQRFGRLDDAALALASVDQKSEIRATADRMAMAVFDKAKEPEKALKVGQTAVKAHPADVDLLLSYADLLRDKSHFTEAIAAYDAALAKISPTSNRKGVALYHRGIAYQQAKKWPHAETDLLAALQLRPDDPGLLNYLAFSWADQGVNLDRARTMLERAIQLVPDDGAIVDSLGWVMYRAGDFDEAIKQLEHAVSLDANDATINDHLGDAYWRAGRQLEARTQWEKASRMTEDKALSEQLRIKLRDGLAQETPPNRAAVN